MPTSKCLKNRTDIMYRLRIGVLFHRHMAIVDNAMFTPLMGDKWPGSHMSGNNIRVQHLPHLVILIWTKNNYLNVHYDKETHWTVIGKQNYCQNSPKRKRFSYIKKTVTLFFQIVSLIHSSYMTKKSLGGRKYVYQRSRSHCLPIF